MNEMGLREETVVTFREDASSRWNRAISVMKWLIHVLLIRVADPFTFSQRRQQGGCVTLMRLAALSSAISVLWCGSMVIWRNPLGLIENNNKKNGKSRLTLSEGDEFETVLSVPIPLSDTVIGPEEMSTSSSSLSTGITDSSLCVIWSWSHQTIWPSVSFTSNETGPNIWTV